MKRFTAALAVCALALPLAAYGEETQTGSVEDIAAKAWEDAKANNKKAVKRYQKINHAVQGLPGTIKARPGQVRNWAGKAQSDAERETLETLAVKVDEVYSGFLAKTEDDIENHVSVTVAHGHLGEVASGDKTKTVGDHTIGWDAQNWGEWGEDASFTPHSPKMTFSTTQDGLQSWTGPKSVIGVFATTNMTWKGQAVGSYVLDTDGDGTTDDAGLFGADATLTGYVLGNDLTIWGTIDNFRDGKKLEGRDWTVTLNRGKASATEHGHYMTGTTSGDGAYSAYAYGAGDTPDFIRGGFSAGVADGHVAGHFGADR